ncbi:chloride channel F [Actinidia rufa]|uniref:Chloride channel F n=1 Tax=Actinidia rufa TaxID=165716 RepID=A0A7J0GPY8_9ERIC|nr:chloride channel F [Actinidia rufa]
MLCGVVSVIFTRLVTWFSEAFEFIKEKFDIPAVACPALGALVARIIALKYPGILYWGFTNVDEILRTGKSASAPGIWLLAQLAAAKVIAAALWPCGWAICTKFNDWCCCWCCIWCFSCRTNQCSHSRNSAVTQPQAYALVGMAATLASVCSVPLTSVVLLFELRKDYMILLPLMTEFLH